MNEEPRMFRWALFDQCELCWFEAVAPVWPGDDADYCALHAFLMRAWSESYGFDYELHFEKARGARMRIQARSFIFETRLAFARPFLHLYRFLRCRWRVPSEAWYWNQPIYFEPSESAFVRVAPLWLQRVHARVWGW